MKKIMVVFGTRPEAIKMAPVVRALKENDRNEVIVLATAQHRSMLDSVMRVFSLKSDYDLNIMQSGQSLESLTALILNGVSKICLKERPDLMLVHGDTTTAFASALAAFYQRITVGHVEAGLRTYDLHHPFPEEANRSLISKLANYHFAPTKLAVENLIRENTMRENIWQTGNTVVDALRIADQIVKETKIEIPGVDSSVLSSDDPIILVTGHRRENIGEGLRSVCDALRSLVLKFHNLRVIYPVHLNPEVRKTVYDSLSAQARVHLIEPVDYLQFIKLMDRATLLLSDSGGVQEEAPVFGKPVLVTRRVTERPEAIEAGTAKLVGTNSENIVKIASDLLEHKQSYEKMSEAKNPFGDGFAANYISQIIEEVL